MRFIKSKSIRQQLMVSGLLISMFFPILQLFAEDWKKGKLFFDAIKKDDVKTVKTFIAENKGLLEKKIKYHSFPVFDATENGSLKTLKFFHESGVNFQRRADKTGNTCLHFAIFNRSKKKREAVLDFLLDEVKMNVDILNDEKQTPFMLAFMYRKPVYPSVKRDTEIIEYFIPRKANINLKDKSGKTILSYILGNFAVYPDMKQTQLVTAVEIPTKLIENGADVNIVDAQKRSPLIIFIKKTPKKIPEDWKIDFVTKLLENGANAKLRSKKGEKALKLVDKKGELYKVLRKRYKKKKKKK